MNGSIELPSINNYNEKEPTRKRKKITLAIKVTNLFYNKAKILVIVNNSIEGPPQSVDMQRFLGNIRNEIFDERKSTNNKENSIRELFSSKQCTQVTKLWFFSYDFRRILNISRNKTNRRQFTHKCWVSSSSLLIWYMVILV